MAFFGKKKNKQKEVEDESPETVRVEDEELVGEEDFNSEEGIPGEELDEDITSEDSVDEEDEIESEDMDDEEEKLKAKIRKLREERQKKALMNHARKSSDTPKVIYVPRAVSTADMFNNISDRLEILERWAKQMTDYLRDKE